MLDALLADACVSISDLKKTRQPSSLPPMEHLSQF
jgi:hypothetical protein